jgi:predicted negative regulator of RcsB-dependent stress response
VEQYRTEEEQVEAVRRWWNEYGRSTIAAVVIALAAGFGWQAWQANQERQSAQASDLYQALLRSIEKMDPSAPTPEGIELAEQIKRDYGDTAYAQFAALHLAAMSVNKGELAAAQAQLEWVQSKAAADSDVARIARQRLARVLAAAGDTEQALKMLAAADPGPYGASYAVAQGDILLGAGKQEEAREAYSRALEMAATAGQGVNLPMLQQKLQSLTPVPPRALEAAGEAAPAEPAPATGDSAAVKEE